MTPGRWSVVVVDIRYHLASIVAVFLALGLGILIGAALQGGKGLEQQERWLASLEHELQTLRRSKEESAALLREVGAERDRYKAFAAHLSEGAMRGLLDGERAALVVFGGEAAAAGRVEDVLRRSGASLVRKAAVAPAASEADLIRLLTPLEGGSEGTGGGGGSKAPGAALAAALVGGPQVGFAVVDEPSFTLQAMSDERPTIAVMVLGSRSERHREVAAQLARALGDAGVRTAAVVLDEGAWMQALERWGIPFVAHFGTPMGELSLVVSLETGEAAGFGLGEGRAPWPAGGAFR